VSRQNLDSQNLDSQNLDIQNLECLSKCLQATKFRKRFGGLNTPDGFRLSRFRQVTLQTQAVPGPSFIYFLKGSVTLTYDMLTEWTKTTFDFGRRTQTPIWFEIASFWRKASHLALYDVKNRETITVNAGGPQECFSGVNHQSSTSLSCPSPSPFSSLSIPAFH